MIPLQISNRINDFDVYKHSNKNSHFTINPPNSPQISIDT
jgi:hypothetical protein